jgi:hypothetical protein
VRLRTSPITSGRFQDHIGILDGIAGTDQADRLGNAPFEFNMWFEGDRNIAPGIRKGLLDLERVFGLEFICHVNLPDHKVGFQGLENLQNRRDIVNQ